MFVWLRKLEACAEVNFLPLLLLMLSDHMLHLLALLLLYLLLFYHPRLGITSLEVFVDKLLFLPEQAIVVSSC